MCSAYYPRQGFNGKGAALSVGLFRTGLVAGESHD
jgi:hypothetical protein